MAGLLSLAGALSGTSPGFLKDDAAFSYLIPLTQDYRPEPGASRSFQFWPAEITDNAAVNYSNKSIPGSNLPFYQWISGGEHNVSFSTFFAADIYYTLQNTSVPEDKHTVNVGAACKWLRSLKEPTYIDGKDFAVPPPLLQLVIPNVPIGPDLNDTMFCLMTQCDIVWKKSFPDGTPRLAQVSLNFVEVVQVGSSKFYGRSDYTMAQSAYNFTKGQ
jgi:hypothetical protein